MKKRVLIALACAGAVALLLALVAGAAASPDALTLVSGAGSDMVAVSSDGSTYGASAPAVLTWKHGSWPLISGSNAAWISSALYVEDPANDSWRLFTRTFDLCPGAYNMSGGIQVTSDNAEIVKLNGIQVGSDGEVWDPHHDDQEWQTILPYDLTGSLQAGTNTLVTLVRNYRMSGGSQTSNPTGLIYRADITYDCPIQVDIDIKPGSFPNCFNSDGHGVIPVAILGSADFDVTQILPGTVKLDSLDVRAVGKSGKLLAHIEDVNDDGFDDLVVQIEDSDGSFSGGNGTAKVSGQLFDGTPFEGTDSICIVP